MPGVLTPKQQRFVEEYLVDLSPSDAADRVGVKPSTCSNWLKLPHVQLAIDLLRQQRSARVQVQADDVLRELYRLAFFDPGEVVSGVVGGINKPEDIAALPEHVRRCIVGWGWDKLGNFTIKLADKLKALEMIGRHLGMFHDHVKVEHDLSDRLADRLAEARARRVVSVQQASEQPSQQPQELPA